MPKSYSFGILLIFIGLGSADQDVSCLSQYKNEIITGHQTYTFGPYQMRCDSNFDFTIKFADCPAHITAKSDRMSFEDKLAVWDDKGFSQTKYHQFDSQVTIDGTVQPPAVHINAKSAANNYNRTLYINFQVQKCNNGNGNGDGNGNGNGNGNGDGNGKGKDGGGSTAGFLITGIIAFYRFIVALQ